MSRSIRSWLFIVFICLFAIGTTTISLYASGYRLKLGQPLSFNRVLIKTGMIIVSSAPSGASIFLNEEPQIGGMFLFGSKKTLTTENKLKNIMPGEYWLKLEHEGYWPWEKNISVQPGQSTLVLKVNLFRNDQPQLIATAPETDLQLSPSRRYLFLDKTKQIIAIRNGDIFDLNEYSDLADTARLGKWRKNTDELIWGEKIISVPKLNINDYSQLIGINSATSYEEASGRLYYHRADALGYLNISNQNVTLLTGQGEFIAHEARADALWWLSRNEGQITLHGQSLVSGLKIAPLALPSNGEYEFKNENSGRLTLYDRLHRTLYLINPNNPNRDLIRLEPVDNWQWLGNESLIYHNDWEIQYVDLNNQRSYLITRLGQKIKNIIWHRGRNYLIILSNQGLLTYDLRLETITQILTADKISSPVLDHNAQALYFWAELPDGPGVYRLRL